MWRYGLYRAAMESDYLWGLWNVAVWAVSSGYLDGHFLGTGEFGGLFCNDRLWKGTVCVHCSMWQYRLYRQAT